MTLGVKICIQRIKLTISAEPAYFNTANSDSKPLAESTVLAHPSGPSQHPQSDNGETVVNVGDNEI